MIGLWKKNEFLKFHLQDDKLLIFIEKRIQEIQSLIIKEIQNNSPTIRTLKLTLETNIFIKNLVMSEKVYKP